MFFLLQNFRSQVYLDHAWRDERLAFSPEKYGGINRIPLSKAHSDQIWLPDTIFANMLSLSHHDGVFESGEGYRYCYLNANGEVEITKLWEFAYKIFNAFKNIILIFCNPFQKQPGGQLSHEFAVLSIWPASLLAGTGKWWVLLIF